MKTIVPILIILLLFLSSAYAQQQVLDLRSSTGYSTKIVKTTRTVKSVQPPTVVQPIIYDTPAINRIIIYRSVKGRLFVLKLSKNGRVYKQYLN